MIDLFTLYQKVCGTFNTQQGGHIRPHRNFVDWANDISMQLFNEYVAIAEKNQQITDFLNPFLQSINVIVSPLAGRAYDSITLPALYEHYSSSRVFYDRTLPVIDGCDGKLCESPYEDADERAKALKKAEANLVEVPITKVSNSRWGGIMQHRNLYPTAAAPKLTQFDGGYKIAPKELGIIVLDFWRIPKLATFNYTITNPGAIDEYYQYNAGTSQPLEWSATLVNEFVNRIGKKYGVFIREQFVFETSENEKKTIV